MFRHPGRDLNQQSEANALETEEAQKLEQKNLTVFEEFQSRKRKVSDSINDCIMETFIANVDSVFGSMISHDISYHWGAVVVSSSYGILMS